MDEISRLQRQLQREKGARRQAEAIAEEKTQELFVKNSELQDSNEFKDEFLAVISHELRTPLNGLMILVDMMLNDKGGDAPTPSQKESLTHIKANANDLRLQIDAIIEMSELLAGRMTFTRSVSTISEIIESLRQSHKKEAQQKQLRFMVDIAPEVPASIDTDADLLKKALNELLSNAIKFTESGFIRLSVGLSQGLRARWVFTIKDTGLGIAKPLHKRIFHPFRQLDIGVSRQYDGMGIGLTRAKKLVELLGGNIQLKSEAGQGAEFIVFLPIESD